MFGNTPRGMQKGILSYYSVSMYLDMSSTINIFYDNLDEFSSSLNILVFEGKFTSFTFNYFPKNDIGSTIIFSMMQNDGIVKVHCSNNHDILCSFELKSCGELCLLLVEHLKSLVDARSKADGILNSEQIIQASKEILQSFAHTARTIIRLNTPVVSALNTVINIIEFEVNRLKNMTETETLTVHTAMSPL